jgi:hypothetical protein
VVPGVSDVPNHPDPRRSPRLVSAAGALLGNVCEATPDVQRLTITAQMLDAVIICVGYIQRAIRGDSQIARPRKLTGLGSLGSDHSISRQGNFLALIGISHHLFRAGSNPVIPYLSGNVFSQVHAHFFRRLPIPEDSYLLSEVAPASKITVKPDIPDCPPHLRSVRMGGVTPRAPGILHGHFRDRIGDCLEWIERPSIRSSAGSQCSPRSKYNPG